MRQLVQCQNYRDCNDNPAGGFAHGCGINIRWQDGPLAVNGQRKAPNGAFVEDVIAVCIQRLQFYQHSPFQGVHNAVALSHLQAALEVLDERTRDRERRGVEGTHKI